MKNLNGDITVQRLGTAMIRPNQLMERKERVVKYLVIARSFGGEVRSQYCYGTDQRDAYIAQCEEWFNRETSRCHFV